MKLTALMLIALTWSASADARTKAKGKAKTADESAPAASAPAASASNAALETPEAAAKAMASPVAKFEEGGLYKITTKVGGQDYAITWIVPGGESVNPSAITNNASKSKVELQKPNGALEQSWQPHERPSLTASTGAALSESRYDRITFAPQE